MSDVAEMTALERVDRVTQALSKKFDRTAAVVARAPGRVNLIGEHTDYNQGWVLPCAIDRQTLVAVAPREDGILRVYSEGIDQTIERPLRGAQAAGNWSDYVVAPAWSLEQDGRELGGADVVVHSDVPPESGLSSSAALGVAMAHAFSFLAGSSATSEDLALAAWRGECEFVGVGCGILDQFASALGRAGHALRIDCRDRSVEHVLLDDEAVFLVAHSGVPRALAHGRYRERVDECAAALAEARAARVADASAESLRDFSPADLPALQRALKPLLFRRVRHVVTENQRVADFASSLASGDLATAGAVLDAGMASLRDDYQVSVPELDALCEIANEHPACLGSRLTGAGWGGCTIHLAPRSAAADLSRWIDAGFERRFGRSARTLVAQPSDGAAVLRP